MTRSVITVIAILGVTHAISSRAASRTAATRSGETMYVGDVTSVNVREKEFVVRGTESGEPFEMKFKVLPQTRIQVNGSLILLSQLERGSRVTVGYRAGGQEAFTADH